MKNYPLTQTQLGIYLAEQNAGESENYNIAMLYHLDDDIDTDRLRKALCTVIDNHPSIKARLVMTDAGELRMEDHADEPARVEVRDVNSVAEIRGELARRFDLFSEPLYRLVIYRTEGKAFLYSDFHHIAFDGMSFRIFLRELSEAYEGKALQPEGKDAFAVATEEEALRQTEAFAEAKTWYAAEYGAAADLHTLPLPDRHEPEDGCFIEKYFPLTIEHSAATAFCEKEHVGISIPFTAAFALTMARLTGSDEALFSTIFHGRTDKATLGSLAMMVKTLPVYHNLQNTPRTSDLLQATRQQMKEARQRTIYSYADTCTDLGLNPQVCLAFQGTFNNYDVILDGKRQVSEDLRVARPGYTMMFNVLQELDGSYRCKVSYPPSQYSEAAIGQICACFDTALHELLVKENVADIQLLDAKAAEILLEKGRTAPLDFDRGDTVVSLFRRQATATPEATCVVYDDPSTGQRCSYTYRQVDELTDLMAARLTVLGAGPEQAVGVMVGRSERIVLFPLAIMKAGAAYMPLDSHFPEDRLSFMCEDAKVNLIITEDNLMAEAMPSFAGTVLTYDDLTQPMAALPELTAPKPENMHVVLYTSGSTGKPKGVILEQRNMVAFCHWFTHYYNITAADRVAAFANFGFDVHQADLWPILTVGGSIYVIPQDMRLDLTGLEEYINRNALTVANITTQIGSMFAAAVKKSSLRVLVVAGEKLGPTPKPDYGFYNAYGPTECTIYATCYDIESDYDSALIGKALAGYAVAVVDSHLNLLPAGTPGELLIMGEGVGRGYLNRPDVTAEKFITFQGQRAYRTGDQVRMLPDGQIEYIGRMDGQVKLRGLRIELGEVEAALLRHPAVKACAAAVKDIAGTQHLCAYYVLHEGEAASEEALKEFMGQSVTDFMVPDYLMPLEALPYNANGKVDRKKLPVPEVGAEAAEGGDAEVAHVWSQLQLALRDDIQSLTGAESIGINSTLGHFGLSSLLAMKLAVQLFKQYGVKIAAKELPRLSILAIGDEIVAQLLNKEQQPETKPQEGGKEAAAIDKAPLTFSQQGVFIDCQMNPDDIIYNLPYALTFPASVSEERIAEAVQKVAAAHPALFCNFVQESEGVMMKMSEDRTLTIASKALTPDELQAKKEAFPRAFNLESDRLVRAEIVTTPDGIHTLLIDMHHIVSDGGSMNIFIHQLIETLNGHDIEPESYGYLQFAQQQSRQAEGEAMKVHKAFYDKMFERYEAAATVPTDKNEGQIGKPQDAATPIPEALLNMQLPEEVTPAHFWFAAFNYALSRYANTKDVYTAFVSNGRQNIDIADTVGMFVNTLPCAVHIGEQTVEDFLREVSKNFNDVLNHENYPFTRIASDYDFKGSASFAYQLGVFDEYLVEGAPVTQELLTLSRPKIALCLYIENYNGVPCVKAVYDDAQYSHDLVLHFTESIVATAEHFAAQMKAPVKTISIMSERQRLEVEAMHSVHEDLNFPIRTFHQGIEQWAEKTPDALAIMACDRDLTYRQYNDEANQMARALMARGVKRGDRVILLLPRRSYYLTALFAVMKCGAAFIPMDPEYPADRIAYILEDAGGRYIITTSDKVAEHPGRAIDIAELQQEGRKYDTHNLDIEVSPHDLAYLIYTSGSTGRPKGVMIEHLGAASFLTFYKSDTNYGSDSQANRVGLCQSSVSFDLSVGEIGVQVFNGDTVAFANEDEMMSPVEMVKLCRRTGAQTISGTPSRLAVNLELEEYHDLIKNQMKCVVTGGEKLPAPLLDELEKMDVYIINTYGPTETTMGSSAGVLNGTHQIHVGKPFTNYTYQVLDSDRNELPVGVMGELCIGGIGLARGYNNMPERTAETFITWQGKRIYRTGDYSMWTPEGNIIIMGRTDNQVKLNGLRIELGEVESVMSQHAGMKQCVAIIKKLGPIDKLIGYYTVDESVAGIPVEEYEEALRTEMAVKLTPYMVPGIFVRLDEIPLTPVGKTDVKRLPTPSLQNSAYVAPQNATEKTFCEIFQKILHIERIGATDNFFELGGTSLVAMQLIAEAAKAGFKMVYKQVFDHATPRLLAQMFDPEAGHKSDETASKPFIDQITNYDYAPLESVLALNTLDNFRAGECYATMGNVFLAGATGFLGIHVLHNLIQRDDVPHIYCLVRPNKVLNAESRLRTLLAYYFGNAYEELFQSGRLIMVQGDVTDAKVFQQFNEPIDVLINCAANVKHFSAGTDIEDINITGAQNCIDLCLRLGARFIQTSTGSVAGAKVSDNPEPPHMLSECDLYYGQELPTKYAASKFLAERAVIHAVRHQGLRGKIMRLGNLSARSTDGEFQINFRSNNAMSALKAYQTLGCFPYSRDFGYSEFSPINEVADAVVRLSLTPDCCTIFQPGNVHWPPYGDIIECMNRLGLHIERVEDDVFKERLAQALNDPAKSSLVQSLVAYSDASDGKVHTTNGWDPKSYTAQVLLRLGFRWSFTTWDYLYAYLGNLQSLGVFDEDYQR